MRACSVDWKVPFKERQIEFGITSVWWLSSSFLYGAAVPAAPRRVRYGLYACDRAGLRPLLAPPPPAPSLGSTGAPIKETLAAKLDRVADIS